MLNAIFYLLCEGCRWRAWPGDFPAWQTVYTYFRNWHQDGTWAKIHEHLRQWVRIDQDREPSPTEAIIDSQSVKSAAMVSQDVGFDGGKLIGVAEFIPQTHQGFLADDLIPIARQVFKLTIFTLDVQDDDHLV